MNVKIKSSTPDRKHPGLFRIVYVTGVKGYRVRIDGVMDRRFKADEYEIAVDELRKAREAQRIGTRPTGAGGRTPVAQVIDQFGVQLRADEATGHIAHGTVLNYLGSLKYLRKVHGDLPIGKLGIAQLQEVITRGLTTGIDRADGKAPRKWGKETHRLFIITTNLLLDFAVERHLVPINIARHEKGLRAPKQTAGTRVESDWWTPAEMVELRGLFDEQDDDLTIAFHLMMAGFRRAEVAGLRWSDIDEKGGFILIQNTRVDYADGVVEKGPKSGKPRPFPLADPVLMEALKRHRVRQRVQSMMHRREYVRSGYVVTTELGGPYQPKSIGRAWTRFLRRHGFRHLRGHGSRHSFLSQLANTPGVPIDAVRRMAGHASLRTTETYLHTDKESLMAAAQVAAAALANVAETGNPDPRIRGTRRGT